ncbi:MAG: hypothetical protein MI919_02570 [Holophagales bacterium]|nr:hypothetical protein [Holophagales bacterium]
MPDSGPRIVANGQCRAARANDLAERRAAAAAEIYERWRPKIEAAPWPKSLLLRLRMAKAIRRAQRRVEDEIAPREGLYLASS